ncbi:lipoprotein 17-related variable surface protein, partial [Mycoplasma bradburyae]|uniref:lipoprotein 17-related variable surface protein n=1 Tax=Mycoplasma bradburyae TaxID=2963128 RepID=UPI0023409541
KNPNNGGGTTTTPPTTGGGGGATTSNPSGGSDGSNNMTPSEPANSKKAVEAYVSKLNADNFKLVDSMNKDLVKEETKVDQIQPTYIKLKDESNPAIQGWALGVELVSNSDSSNPENGSLKFKVKFSKEGVEVTSNEITISGFKTLQTAVAKALLKEMTVKD